MLNKRLAIDIGSSFSRLFTEEKGLILEIPSIVAIHEETEKIVAVGEQAKKLVGRELPGIKAVSPIENGAVSNFKGAEAIFSELFRLSLGKFIFFRPEVIMSIPLSTTQVERRTLIDAAIQAGAKQAYLVEQPLAAAIGAKIPVSSTTGNLVLYLGAGVVECAVISSGTIVASSWQKGGMKKIDKQIGNYIAKKKNLIVGKNTLEKLKENLAFATPSEKNLGLSLEINGKDMATQMPKTIKITDEEISSSVVKFSQEIVSCIKKVFENTPAELSADIIEKGIMLIGGGAKLKNLNKLIIQSTGLACHISINPDRCTILGLGEILKNPEVFKF